MAERIPWWEKVRPLEKTYGHEVCDTPWGAGFSLLIRYFIPLTALALILWFGAIGNYQWIFGEGNWQCFIEEPGGVHHRLPRRPEGHSLPNPDASEFKARLGSAITPEAVAEIDRQFPPVRQSCEIWGGAVLRGVMCILWYPLLGWTLCVFVPWSTQEIWWGLLGVRESWSRAPAEAPKQTYEPKGDHPPGTWKE